MKSYWVRVSVKGVKYEYACWAESWYQAFEVAIDKWGIPSVMCIKPA
jgi:hypothetical protein